MLQSPSSSLCRLRGAAVHPLTSITLAEAPSYAIMDSDLQSILATFQFGNYLCAALVTAIAHDYILTFPREVDYVWKRPWTSMSTLFLLS
ncbi:hypothetical protein PAXRUDRAFT_824983 [Paxillus rubicundulus Ve08.2h10]|uniref:DUF6533 domain-containing protein n=1 Tax=Paxillus rubicundulus Ve08.2h10 TaxID=930991 RepID=A0A0D0E158_9AGAM|nr:hypothetical protein PAXRUDRAFT_824983 [Paxillus rubicundulus Ve08.2h10]